MRFFSKLKKTGNSSPAPSQNSGEKEANSDTCDSSLNFDYEKDPNAIIHPSQPLEYEQDDAGYQTEGDDSYTGDEDDNEFAELPSANSSKGRLPKARILDALEMMADDIYRYGSDWRQWFVPSTPENFMENVNTGVSIRSKNGKHVLYPYACPGLKEFGSAIDELNPAIALKLSSPIIRTILADFVGEREAQFTINANSRIQVLDSINLLGQARKHQYAAFIRDESVLCVWSDNVKTVLSEAEALEDALLDFIWNAGTRKKRHLDNDENLGHLEIKEEDIGREEGEWSANDRRPVMLYAPLVSGLAIILNCVFVASGVRNLIKESLLDANYIRFALMATVPFGFLLATFFCICVIGNLWQMFGPIAHFRKNSSYYSGAAPVRMTGALPQMTVMMPVYKEGLEGVIVPTIESLKVAMSTYERQGGAVNIVICDDGMQIWEPEEAERRQAFYERNNIGWCARPKHNHNGFIRKGKFKKASNMNFTNKVSLRVEEIMDELRPQPFSDEDEDWEWSARDEQKIYEEALGRALEESNGLAWAKGNIRIGEIILIIDSDTRVPTDCFLDAASEMHWAPELSIIQHESSVMQVIEHYFENGITSFTTRINSAISFCVTNGEVSPFIGHNAFLRWAAVQDAAFVDPDDGITKQWNESCVSEDFDLSLRIQMKGWTMRWASYTNGGFQEGVSLTAVDELNRWQKYAYGCSEMLFNPISKWFSRGPINRLFRLFVWSEIPIHSKISTLAYISSYYAIACAFPLSTVNWVLIGLFRDSLDSFYLESWNVFLTCVVIFCGLSNISSAIFQYRLKQNTLGAALIGNFKWLFFFFFFFCGMSYHLSTALLAHLTGYDMSWAMTEKEVDFSNFFKEVPAIYHRFWTAFIPAFLVMIGCGVMASSYIPEGYRILDFTAILPAMAQAGSHFLYPSKFSRVMVNLDGT
ncbi:hypothetical protein QFC19_000742 [Naganishia cerealis]|uniref:Uncharacterized protein n=1 Tax=Naganishia cerealis TaxID=610337 RepID=A0ACC2WP89_9TREE|nr:hypothetical protein QFC19_000742 [Naganishia cerealis]